MKRLLFAGLILAITSTLFAQQKPKLVVGIVVDQMRQDYLLRFSDKFQDGGFKRLVDQGFQFKNAHYNYVPTYTAPGHASIYTGTTPAYHGIVGNNWYDKSKNLEVYCVSDKEVSGVGGNDNNGKMSPKNLQASTITDELLLSSNFRSKIIGVSIKDRGSIIPAGHNPTGAYWFDSSTGNFMTSTYYAEKLPDWASKFNKSKKTSFYLNKTWSTLLPIEEYTESTDDDVPYEWGLRGKDSPTLPYDLSKLVKESGPGLIRSTPFGNSLVLDFGLEAIKSENLGQDDITDFLALSFSSTDYVGHSFGPNSIELEDTYLRLDLEIKRLLDYLDANYPGEYLVFLTADHGVTEVPQLLKDKKMIGGYLNKSNAASTIQKGMVEHFGEGEWLLNASNDQLFINQTLVKEKELDITVVRKKLKEIVLTINEVALAYTADELIERNATDLMKKRFENGYNLKLSGDVIVNLKPGHLSSPDGQPGTSHGTGYTYDTHVPLLFFGQGITAGKSVRPVEITDIATTLSMLLDISIPTSSTGVPLKELFE